MDWLHRQIGDHCVEHWPALVGDADIAVGQPLDEAATYTLATNDYMAGGGDGYSVFASAMSMIDPIDATLMASQVIDYIAAKGTVAPKVEGRINVL